MSVRTAHSQASGTQMGTNCFLESQILVFLLWCVIYCEELEPSGASDKMARDNRGGPIVLLTHTPVSVKAEFRPHRHCVDAFKMKGIQ